MLWCRPFFVLDFLSVVVVHLLVLSLHKTKIERPMKSIFLISASATSSRQDSFHIIGFRSGAAFAELVTNDFSELLDWMEEVVGAHPVYACPMPKAYHQFLKAQLEAYRLKPLKAVLKAHRWKIRRHYSNILPLFYQPMSHSEMLIMGRCVLKIEGDSDLSGALSVQKAAPMIGFEATGANLLSRIWFW